MCSDSSFSSSALTRSCLLWKTFHLHPTHAPQLTATCENVCANPVAEPRPPSTPSATCVPTFEGFPQCLKILCPRSLHTLTTLCQSNGVRQLTMESFETWVLSAASNKCSTRLREAAHDGCGMKEANLLCVLSSNILHHSSLFSLFSCASLLLCKATATFFCSRTNPPTSSPLLFSCFFAPTTAADSSPGRMMCNLAKLIKLMTKIVMPCDSISPLIA